MIKDKYQSIRIWKATYKKLLELVGLLENKGQVQVLDELVTKELKKVKSKG